jgi:hypothetical protein
MSYGLLSFRETMIVLAGPQAAGLARLAASHGPRIVDPNLRHGLWGSDRRREPARRAAAPGPREVVVRSASSIGALTDGA